MQPAQQALEIARRRFLTSAASGAGAMALANLLKTDGLLAADTAATNPLAPKQPHFAPKATHCIFLYAAGGPSQVDLFDPKPMLNQLDGEQLPDSVTKGVRFAFIKPSARILGSPRKFKKHGQCGMELSDLFPQLGTCADDLTLIRSMHTDEFNHHPAQLLLSSGVGRFGRPSMGSWINYGLGSESQNLPGYVVLSAGRGASGGASNWSSGFLPSTYQGVGFRNQGEPVLNLQNPPGVSRQMQAESLEAIRRFNQRRYDALQDPEIASRIAAYELAFRMQAAAPELIDLTAETQQTLDAYGVDRGEPTDVKSALGGGPGVYNGFARNCLLARRLVERGVRFVTLMFASWDQHDNLNERLTYNARMTDQPVAALLKDLKQRGLLDTTLVVFAGEFGRTALVQGDKRDGRDHHPFAFSVWMAGGGIKPGQVVGKTDDFGWHPVEDPIHVHDFHATMLHVFGLDHLKLTKRFGGLDVRLTDVFGKLVPKLLA